MKGPSVLRVFFDSDVIISGSFSQSGASFLLLQLSELGFINGIISPQVIEESKRNIQKKLPSALALFNNIIKMCHLELVSPTNEEIQKALTFADKKDVPILAAALKANADYLTTFNTKDYYPSLAFNISIVKPKEILRAIGNRYS
ncbi:MAG: PIN domain-containing protein [Candidatus Marinimicrobia bacterium]|nr:PIN domain-containing protein [Candidatus Neomarinimicrobiota bacterium]MCH7763747.1 PIN domain-containing protein [Candidatus Neomarinimicrobiota bacterium]